MDWLFDVWSVPGVTAAIVGGLVFGWAIRRPFYILVVTQTTIVFFFVLLTGAVFFGGQIVDTLLADPVHASRVTSRFAEWVVFSLAVAIGTRLAGPRRLP
jgi:uncharacterized membrane protein YedE/YeeE